MGQQIELPLMMQVKIIVELGTRWEPCQIWEQLTQEQKQAVKQRIQIACRVLASQQKTQREVGDDDND